MHIFILRHGHAEAQVTTDDARNLTSTGRTVTHSVIRDALPQLQSVQQIWASPLVRAQQTAHIALHFFPHLQLQTIDCLIPEANPQDVYAWLESMRENSSVDLQSVLLVSHQPLVGSLVNQLCGQSEHFHAMDTSSLAAIKTDVVAPAMGELLWLRHGR